MAIRFSYFKSVRDHGSSCVISVGPSLAVVAIAISLNSMNPMSIDRGREISSSADRFDLSSLNDKVPFVHMVLDDTEI